VVNASTFGSSRLIASSIHLMACMIFSMHLFKDFMAVKIRKIKNIFLNLAARKTHALG